MLGTNLKKGSGATEKLLLLIAKRLATKQELSRNDSLILQDNIEWNKFRSLIIFHELGPLAYISLKKYHYLLPKKEKEFLEERYYYFIAHNSFLWEEFKYIIDIFKDKNIEFLPLKGIAFVIDDMYADKTNLRPKCDIDILIKEKEISLVEKILKIAGYKKETDGLKEKYWREKGYHLGFVKKNRSWPSSVEIHWGLDYKRDKPILSDIWKRVKKIHVEGREIHLLSPEDTLFSLALHQRRFGRVLSLKNVCDVTMLLNKNNTQFDWDYILRQAGIDKTRTTLYFLLEQAHLLFNVQIPSFIQKVLNVPQWKKRLVKNFILNNIFSPASSLIDPNLKNLYLRSHFLLYDNFWEPVKYILDLPQEQFAKFYGLSPYANKTNLLYRIRYLYYLKYLFAITLKTISKIVTQKFHMYIA